MHYLRPLLWYTVLVMAVIIALSIGSGDSPWVTVLLTVSGLVGIGATAGLWWLVHRN